MGSRATNTILVFASLSLVLFFQNCSQNSFSSTPTSAQSIPPGGGPSPSPTITGGAPVVTVTATTCSTQNPTCDITLTLSNANGPVSLLFSTACLDNNANVVPCPATGTGPNGQTLPYGAPNTDFAPDYSGQAVTLEPGKPIQIPIQDIAPTQSSSYEFLIPWAVQDCAYVASPHTACVVK